MSTAHLSSGHNLPGGQVVCPCSGGSSEGIELPVSLSDSAIIPVCSSSFSRLYVNLLVTTP